jgi:Tetratricopeptide repeat
MTNLALLERDTGKFEEAAHLLRRAHALRSAALGAEHASTQRLKQLLEEADRRLAQPGDTGE